MANENTVSMKTFSTGDIIIQEGPEAPKEMIIVLQGNVGVFKNYKLNSEIQLKVIGQGSFHGEFPLFLAQEQKETLVALTNVAVMVVSEAGVNHFFSKHSSIAASVVTDICKKLFDSTEELRKLRPAEDREQSRRSGLFPEKHGSYRLSGMNNTSELLYASKTTCPLCAHTFDSLTVLQSKLRLDKTDTDLRTRYKGFEPLYYEITTCPNCFFSASSGSFASVSRHFADKVNQKVGPYKLEMYVLTGADRDTFSVFAGFYLALLCAPAIYPDHQLTTSGLWLKISRLYQDCEDQEMYLYAAKKALDEYNYALEHINMSEKQSQHICYIMGGLYLRMGDVNAARNFFHMAKMNKEGTPLMRQQADMRLEETRELLLKQEKIKK